MSRRYLSTVDAANYLGVSKNTLRKLIAQGVVPAHRLGDRLLRFDTDELDAALRRGEKPCK